MRERLMAGQERAGERGTGWASVCVLRESLELAAQEKRVVQGRGCVSDGLGGQASAHDDWTRGAGGGRHWIGKHICAGREAWLGERRGLMAGRERLHE
jgi:hypothetical protein